MLIWIRQYLIHSVPTFSTPVFVTGCNTQYYSQDASSLQNLLAFTGHRSLKFSFYSQLLAEELRCGRAPSPDSCVFSCWTGPGHQWVQPVWGRDPRGAGGQEEAGRGAETERSCFQRTAVSLQVTASLLSGPFTLCAILMFVNVCVWMLHVCQTVLVLSQTQAQNPTHADH